MNIHAPISQTLNISQPYQGYAYAYPHKMAYRTLEQPIPLADLWANENQEALFLYLHIPFCEMRCGFCNLFTTAVPQQTLTEQYMNALKRQAEQLHAILPHAHIAQLAVGGGTPTYLTETQLSQLFAIIQLFNTDLQHLPISVETSPKTAVSDKLTYLRQQGVDRISIGIQSFYDDELKSLGRPQRQADVQRALTTIRQVGFPTLNIDLIYGGPLQTPARWRSTLKQTLVYQPEEIYLYPLYVRPLTGMDKMDQEWDEQRLQLYRLGRDFLLENGYVQLSMRHFRLADHAPRLSASYHCQEDGMIGLGCGARSYTKTMHYANRYAVGRRGVSEILTDWVKVADFGMIYHGVHLNLEEQKRRFVIKSLLFAHGLEYGRYQQQFQTTPTQDFPQLDELLAQNLANFTNNCLKLTARGLELSDAIGPWLYSDAMKKRISGFELR